MAGPFIASRAEALIARRAADLLRPMAEAERDVRFSVADRHRRPHSWTSASPHRRPPRRRGAGASLSLLPHDRDLTVAEAADLLGVSQPYLCDVLDRGDIPSHLVGSQRRIMPADVLAYRARLDVESGRAVAEMVRLQQELGLD